MKVDRPVSSYQEINSINNDKEVGCIQSNEKIGGNRTLITTTPCTIKIRNTIQEDKYKARENLYVQKLVI